MVYLKSYPRNGGDAIKTEEGRIWKSMLARCKPNHECPAYHGCSVSENFKNFQYFADWCNKQIGFGCVDEEGLKYHIDKDILVKGNKVYSEDTCVFVPQAVNSSLCKSKATRGLLPVGVSKKRNKFRAYCRDSITKQRVELGCYATPIEAYLVYKNFKEKMLKDLALKYCGVMDGRVVDALINYKVEITD